MLDTLFSILKAIVIFLVPALILSVIFGLILMFLNKDYLNLRARQFVYLSDNNLKLERVNLHNYYFFAFTILSVLSYFHFVNTAKIDFNEIVLKRWQIAILFINIFFIHGAYKSIAKAFDLPREENPNDVIIIHYINMKGLLPFIMFFPILIDVIFLIYPPLMKYIPNI